MSPEEAEDARKAWIEAFPEMKKHMNPEEMKTKKGIWKYYDLEEEEEQIDPSEAHKSRYRATTITGFRRSDCTYNSACNVQFQSVVAEGAKEAMWNLIMAGYADRLLNFIHDEVLYWLYPHELNTNIPEIEKLMIEGMKTVIPDVKVGVESTLMLHWDKGAAEYSKVGWLDNGWPDITEPEFIKGLIAQD